jgi:diguanylate cyclase (GGDEF)-like protein
VLLPIGGLRISGYIEVVFDPYFTLESVSEMTSMPVTILPPGESYTPPPPDEQQKVMLPIEYTLYGDDGQIAYRMIGLEDIDKFNQEMLQTQWMTVIGFLTLIFGIMLASLWLLRIGLFNPLRNLLAGIEAYSQGQLDTTIKPSGLAEIHTLGSTFNEMLQRIRDDMRELERFSTIDELTGIPNRRYFDKCLEHEMRHARRLSRPLTLLYIDIDYFKRYNDHYGHLGGDEALQKVAQAVAGMARRDTDVAARLGGEEFAILLPDTAVENARLLAEALLLAVADLDIAHKKSKIADHLTLSIGLASMVPAIDSAANELIEMSDKALYRAKAEGRNRVVTAE